MLPVKGADKRLIASKWKQRMEIKVTVSLNLTQLEHFDRLGAQDFNGWINKSKYMRKLINWCITFWKCRVSSYFIIHLLLEILWEGDAEPNLSLVPVTFWCSYKKENSIIRVSVVFILNLQYSHVKIRGIKGCLTAVQKLSVLSLMRKTRGEYFD